MSGSGRRGSIWSYLMGRSGETVPDPLVGRISAWRQARQAALIRLERSHEQAMQALASTRDEMHTLRVQPKHVQATAPSIDRGIAAPANDRYAVLLRREEGLQTLCWALLTRLRSAKQEAEALADKTLRARRLVALLDRCRCVYQDAQLSLHAPQPALQEVFEATVCSSHAREGRLLARWVAETSQRHVGQPLTPSRGVDHHHSGAVRASSRGGSFAGDEAAGGGAGCIVASSSGPSLIVPPSGLSPPVVLDVVHYLARLIAAEYGLQSRLPAVQLCTSRLLLNLLQPTIWPTFVERYAAKDMAFAQNQRLLRQLHPAKLGVEARFFGQGTGSVEVAHRPNDPAAPMPPPPAAAALILADFCFLVSPVDQLLCLYRAVGAVHRYAGAAANVESNAIGADSLMPLLVWTVCHASTPCAFAALEYCKQLSSKELTTSELGYYLACLEGACAYILEPSSELADANNGLANAACPASEASNRSSGGCEAPTQADDSARPDLVASHPGQSLPQHADGLVDAEQAVVHESTGGASTAGDSPQGNGQIRAVSVSTGAAPHGTLVQVAEREEAERKALARFLQHERAVDDLVGALCL